MSSMAYDELTELAGEYGLTLTFEFMPQTYPDRTKLSDMGLKWLVTVLHRGNPVLATTYTQGVAHCRSYRKSMSVGHTISEHDYAVIRNECRTQPKSGQPDEPLTALWCIASDCLTVMNCGSFEEWARELGYDTDSRKAEGIYKEIVTQYLSLKRAIGDEEIETLAAVEL
jgi:hypothetical protein